MAADCGPLHGIATWRLERAAAPRLRRGRPRRLVGSSGYVAHTLEASLWSVGRTANFRAAAPTAANLGVDADTTAAVTGQLAGALYGASAIPQDWLDRLAWRDEIEALAGRLFEAGLRE